MLHQWMGDCMWHFHWCIHLKLPTRRLFFLCLRLQTFLKEWTMCTKERSKIARNMQSIGSLRSELTCMCCKVHMMKLESLKLVSRLKERILSGGWAFVRVLVHALGQFLRRFFKMNASLRIKKPIERHGMSVGWKVWHLPSMSPSISNSSSS